MNKTRRGGFTLIEISVVLVIALIISSITFGAFRSVSDGNKRTTCQSNLAQIYQSCRLYAQDYNGKFPYFNAGVAPNDPATPVGGIGLWSLYSYRHAQESNCDDQNLDLAVTPDETISSASSPTATLTGYVRSPRVFHCPADNYDRVVQYQPTVGASACVTQAAKVSSGLLTYVTDGSSPATPERRLNPYYLSYQSQDEVVNVPSSGPVDSTYNSFRGDNLKKQLINFTVSGGTTKTPERPSDDKTVVTWCRFHRSLVHDNTTDTLTTNATGRNYDNVLFYDGSVQNLPSMESTSNTQACATANATCVTGWQRIPKIVP